MKRRVSTGASTVLTSFRLTLEERERLQAIAASRGRSTSEQLRAWLEEAFDDAAAAELERAREAVAGRRSVAATRTADRHARRNARADQQVERDIELVRLRRWFREQEERDQASSEWLRGFVAEQQASHDDWNRKQAEAKDRREAAAREREREARQRADDERRRREHEEARDRAHREATPDPGDPFVFLGLDRRTCTEVDVRREVKRRIVEDRAHPDFHGEDELAKARASEAFKRLQRIQDAALAAISGGRAA